MPKHLLTIARFRRRSRRILCAAAVAAALLPITGCGNPEPPQEPQAAPAPPLVAVKAPASTPRLTLPENFPATVPLLERRRIHSVEQRPSGAISIVYAVPEIRRKAARFYRQQLSGTAWDVVRDSTNGGMVSILARSENGCLLTVNIIDGADGSSTMIGLYLSTAAAPPVTEP